MSYSDQRGSHNLPMKSQFENAITENMSSATIDAIIESYGIKWGIRTGFLSFAFVCLGTFLLAPPRLNIPFAILDYFHYVTTDMHTFSIFLGWAVLSGIVGVLSYRGGRKASKVFAKRTYASLLIEKGVIKICSNCKESIPPESGFCSLCGAKQTIK